MAGFDLKRMAVSNTTKSRLAMPARRWNGAASTSCRAIAKRSGEDGGAPSPPRGILLNASIGGLTFAGGLMGFVTKGSKASLVAGSVFGGLLMLSAFLVSRSSDNRSAKGNMLGFSVAAMLGYVMGKKFLVSKKFVPAGLLASLSAVGFAYNLMEACIVSACNRIDSKEGSPSSTIDTDSPGSGNSSSE